MVPLVKQVMKQTHARNFRGDTRSEGKLFSIFEPSTEIIRKGKAGKPNEFGKVVKIQESETKIVVDYEVYDQRPNDSDVLIPAMEAHQRVLDRTPYLVAADAAFYSRENDAEAKEWESSGSVYPIVPPRALHANLSRRNGGAEADKNGAQDVMDASASQNGATVLIDAATKATEK
jgi:transposase, IS5 family